MCKKLIFRSNFLPQVLKTSVGRRFFTNGREPNKPGDTNTANYDLRSHIGFRFAPGLPE